MPRSSESRRCRRRRVAAGPRRNGGVLASGPLSRRARPRSLGRSSSLPKAATCTDIKGLSRSCPVLIATEIFPSCGGSLLLLFGFELITVLGLELLLCFIIAHGLVTLGALLPHTHPLHAPALPHHRNRTAARHGAALSWSGPVATCLLASRSSRSFLDSIRTRRADGPPKQL